MGLFTYWQAKKTRREVRELRRESGVQTRADRDLALFQQLPPEGKAAFRELDAEFRQLGPFEVRRREELIRARDELFRRYDVMP